MLLTDLDDVEWPLEPCIHASCHVGFDIKMQINHAISKGANCFILGDFDQFLIISCQIQIYYT